jgi:hypothetical protein
MEYRAARPDELADYPVSMHHIHTAVQAPSYRPKAPRNCRIGSVGLAVLSDVPDSNEAFRNIQIGCPDTYSDTLRALPRRIV